MIQQLTEEKIAELKQQYKKLFKTTLDNDQVIVWHPITRADHRRIIESTDKLPTVAEAVSKREEEFCLACVVFPDIETFKTMMEEYAGVATMLTNEILDHSGFVVKEKAQEL